MNWKEIARRLWREKRATEKSASDTHDWMTRTIHAELDKVGCPKSTYFPDGAIYDGAIARVDWLVRQHAAQGDTQAIPRRDFDTALELRDMYAKENSELRKRVIDLETAERARLPCDSSKEDPRRDKAFQGGG